MGRSGVVRRSGCGKEGKGGLVWRWGGGEEVGVATWALSLCTGTMAPSRAAEATAEPNPGGVVDHWPFVSAVF